MCARSCGLGGADAEWELHGSEMRWEVVVVISKLELGLHSNAFDFMNRSSGSVRVIELVTFLRKISKKC